ncbi:DUF7319 domain-containing protein [Halomarina oriensis]|uniref:DUF7319 domain-containing protein n=1 Tax=Halomarina oriensis TaxID=671145 RepID=A0A6B0GEY8_9EURY|nr:hypothetical protein [Halomarina oriensis]MWG33304.1 hypothetical protein [Halomarina oriensis]
MADGPSATRSDDADSDAADGSAPVERDGDERVPFDAEVDDPDRQTDEDLSLDELRAQVEEKYDFENFGPRDMARMSAEEWDAVFDPDSWITGTELLDRLEADLKQRVLDRDVFARVERFENPDRLVAYDEEGYAMVYGDGTVEGTGRVLRDVEPSVALASMEEYDVPELPEGEVLPRPHDVPDGGGDLGHQVLQVVAGVQLLMAVGLVGWGLFAAVTATATGQFGNPNAPILAIAAGLGFLVIGVFLFTLVANARLSDRFRSEEYRDRLRAVGLDSDERPAFLDDLESDGRLAGGEDDSSEDPA